jgi:lysophospholipase L1-like esterase
VTLVTGVPAKPTPPRQQAVTQLGLDTMARGLALRAGSSVVTAQKLNRILRNALRAGLTNPRNAGLFTPAITPVDNGATLPAAVSSSNAYLISGTAPINKGIWSIIGGTPTYAGGGCYRIYSAVIWTTGGNAGGNDGKQISSWRASVMADCRYIAFKVGATTSGYRFLVDGKYVSTAGFVLGTTSGSTAQYILLDFGSRAIRNITLEGQGTCGIGGAYVEATGKLWPAASNDWVYATMLGDSYVYGSAATALGDGVSPTLGDWLGMQMHASGSGGTGWATTGSAYRFDQRIANGDIAIGGVTPDVIFFMASVNDRTLSTATVTTNALAGLRSARAQYPNTPIVVFGCAGASYVTTVTANEAAVQSAVTQFGDPLCAFVPFSTDTNGAWVTGTGTVAAPANNGNSDWVTSSDGTHPTDEGCGYIGRRYAQGALAALQKLLTG